MKLGDTLPGVAAVLGDFEQWIADGLASADAALPVALLDPRRGDTLPPADQIAGVVLTGSPAMVSDRAPWSEATAHWLRGILPAGVPVLGICYGHQLLAHALGGTAGNNIRGLELGTVQIRRLPAADGDALFEHLPDAFPAQVVHSQSALQLPPGAVALAANDWEPHQAVRFGAHCWGVQFHPEFDAQAMGLYVEQLAAGDAPTLQAVQATPASASLLPRFARLVEDRERARAA